MDIGIVTIAYNGYGRFLPQWCAHIAALSKRPTAVTAVLGRAHGLNPRQQARCKSILPSLNIVHELTAKPSFGRYRNVAIEATRTVWIMYLSVDDAILPHAIEEFERHEDYADYIAIRWIVRGLGNPDRERRSALPVEIADQIKKGIPRGNEHRFIIGHSPFRRSFWEQTPYEEHDYPNAPFVAAMVEHGARFVNTDHPCTVYQRRPDSHSKGSWGLKRRVEKHKAIKYRADMEQRIATYYSEQ